MSGSAISWAENQIDRQFSVHSREIEQTCPARCMVCNRGSWESQRVPLAKEARVIKTSGAPHLLDVKCRVGRAPRAMDSNKHRIVWNLIAAAKRGSAYMRSAGRPSNSAPHPTVSCAKFQAQHFAGRTLTTQLSPFGQCTEPSAAT